MRKAAVLLFVLFVVVLMVPSAHAQTGEAAKSGPNWIALGASFGMALAAFGGALGQSKVAASACEGMARNPGAAGAIRQSMFLGLVFIETLALFTLVIIFVVIFKG